MFDSVLIANRGEIACRIIRTARRMGLRTIAVYSDADAGAMHVREADEAVRIGPGPASESYLNVDAIIKAARDTNAQAIHPGYGFLSENQGFVTACESAGIIFVGPSAQAMRLMGKKDEAKRLMEAAGVPVTPGYHGDDQREKTLLAEAEKIGYPLLIKAVAGGGGRGMRRVDSQDAFLPALESARREALSSFGDDRVLLEKFISNPRHIEVQIFGDRRGRYAHFFERECSIQRRHQKVIEEAPVYQITPQMRVALCTAAIDAARAAGYENAGTVEFIAQGGAALHPDRFWFMEMNTRLQVEHPVSEAITGFDFVELQLKIAAGGSVPEQDQIRLRGHAIEARLYAEDPLHNYMPSTGVLETFSLPDATDVRVDTGFEAGDCVSAYYDPMLAKIIAHAPTRALAIGKLDHAIDNICCWPVRINAGFLARILKSKGFASGQYDTGFVKANMDTLSGAQFSLGYQASLALLMQYYENRAASPGNVWQAADGWRMNTPKVLSKRFANDAGAIRIWLKREGADNWRAWTDEENFLFEKVTFADGVLNLDYESDRHTVRAMTTGQGIVLFDNAEVWTLQPPQYGLDGAAFATGNVITAPMPGKILVINAAPGAIVKAGDALIVQEAMKMEHSLVAPRDGTVESVGVKTGDQVEAGAVLLVLADESATK